MRTPRPLLAMLAALAISGLASCEKECPEGQYLILDDCHPNSYAFAGTWHIDEAQCNYGNTATGELIITQGSGNNEIVIGGQITAVVDDEYSFHLSTTTLIDQGISYTFRATGSRTYVDAPGGIDPVTGQPSTRLVERLIYSFWRNEGQASEVSCRITMYK